MIKHDRARAFLHYPALRVTVGLLFFMLCYSTALNATSISGTVKDNNKKALTAVQVTAKGTGISTLTDTRGKFTLNLPADLKSATLEFKLRGYHRFEKHILVGKTRGGLDILLIPQEYLLHTVSVTATNIETEALAVPASERSISKFEIQEKIPENVVESLSDTAGVHFIGSGGFTITPSIRGLARRRVLVLVDGNRITSDRRAGTSIGIVPPELVERIEVVRSASSVLYGSDAIGGVINILTKPSDQPSPGKNSFNLNYSSVNKRINTGLSLDKKFGKWDIFGGFQYSNADDYKTQDETIYHSGYKYTNGLLGILFNSEKRDFYLGYVGGFGKDVGKPVRTNNPNSYSVVPDESEQIIRLGYSEKSLVKNSSLDFSLFLNPSTYNLDKLDLIKNTVQSSYNEALNLGLKSTLKKNPGEAFSYQLGLEWFSRQNVEMENREGPRDNLKITYPLKDGTRNDVGFFAAVDYTGIPGLDLHAGLRYTFFSLSALVEGESKKRDTDSYCFFLGATKKLSSSVSLFLNIGRAFRFPSLSETYYTGITGRNWVIGNPDLLPESSFNIDGGLKIASHKFALGLYLFTNSVNHLIERYKSAENIYTYDNIEKGKIYGGELEFQYSPNSRLDLFGHYFYYKGKSKVTDDPLNDIPAPRILVGGKIFFNRVWFEAEYLHSFKKDNPGPAEVENDAYDLVDLKGCFYFSSALYFYVKVANLFNESYYPNADPDIPIGKGLNISAGIHFNF